MKRTETRNRVVSFKRFILLLLLPSLLFGCHRGSVKPLLDQPEFKAENQPVRDLKLLIITDNTYRKDEIEQFVSKCSRPLELQVGMRLEIADWYQIKWNNELDDISKMQIKVAAETWSKRDQFDLSVAFVHFVHRIEGTKSRLGSIDTTFWRYIFVKELDPNILLHEIFHAFLLERAHSREWVMKAERIPYGAEWYWLTPEERKEVLGNKRRDFNVVPTTGTEAQRKSRESNFFYALGSAFLQEKKYEQAIECLNRSLEVKPDSAFAYNNLSWLLGTADIARYRDGKRAVELALKGCELSKWKNWSHVDTLAAAYARIGDFNNALMWQEKALDIMKSSERSQEQMGLEAMKRYEDKTTAEMKRRLDLYRMHKPWPPD
jgi:tetratricopeptide (TPR) repeat protein